MQKIKQVLLDENIIPVEYLSHLYLYLSLHNFTLPATFLVMVLQLFVELEGSMVNMLFLIDAWNHNNSVHATATGTPYISRNYVFCTQPMGARNISLVSMWFSLTSVFAMDCESKIKFTQKKTSHPCD